MGNHWNNWRINRLRSKLAAAVKANDRYLADRYAAHITHLVMQLR